MLERNSPTLSKSAKRCALIIGIPIAIIYIVLIGWFVSIPIQFMFIRHKPCHFSVYSNSQKQSIERGAFLFRYKQLKNNIDNNNQNSVNLAEAYAENSYSYSSKIRFIHSLSINQNTFRVYAYFYCKDQIDGKLQIGGLQSRRYDDNVLSIRCNYIDSIPPDTLVALIRYDFKEKNDTIIMVREAI